MVGWGEHAVVALLVGLVALAGADCSSDPPASSAACTGFGWTGEAPPACTFATTCPSGKYSIECNADTGACACRHDDTAGMIVEYEAPFCEANSPLDAFAAANAACGWNLTAR